MIDRHLVTDIALAVLLALPFVLPASQTPRSSESRIAEQGRSVVLADGAQAPTAQGLS